MSVLVASKIRRPSRPSIVTSAKSHGSGDWRAAVSSASNCRWVKPKVVIRQRLWDGGRARRVNAPGRRRWRWCGRTRP
jgi:hypothetical protein